MAMTGSNRPDVLLPSLFPLSGGQASAVSQALRDPTEYANRAGYDPKFLSGVEIGFPQLPTAWLADRVPVSDPARAGEEVYDLKYHHFSVVMSASRRMPYFSCVNIDGTRAKTLAAAGTWRRDPRIASEYQILTDGIYGKQGDGLFSRGHMTRREDPVWGTDADAALANEDTFHSTNACPQVQNFNAPIWLGLEDYIKKNVRKDGMRVSVFTGPVFDDANDPWFKPPGELPVQVPTDFWKIVAFFRDDTGELAATAYRASQAKVLPKTNRGRAQFVFGEFNEYQLRIADLEQLNGLKFPVLRTADVLGALSPGYQIKHASVESVILSVD